MSKQNSYTIPQLLTLINSKNDRIKGLEFDIRHARYQGEELATAMGICRDLQSQIDELVSRLK